MLARVGGPKLHLKPEVESVLTELADELLGQALSFGCSMARQRQKNGATAEEQALQPADVAAFLEHSWSVMPDFCVFLRCRNDLKTSSISACLPWCELV